MRDGDEFSRFAGRRQSGLSVGLAPSYQMIPLGKLIGHSYSPTSHFFSFFHPTFFPAPCSYLLILLLSQFLKSPLKMASVARCVPRFASRMLSPKLPIARISPAMGFPRGSIRSFSQSTFCTIVPNSSWKCLFESNMMLIYIVLSCSAGKEVH